MKKMILLLGAPNDEKGHLSQIALDRIHCALDIYQPNEDMFFVCTGGYGKQFNTTAFPHAHYTKTYLIHKGIPEEAFLEPVLSSHTVDDFRKAKTVIEREKPELLLVVTSDFHMKRAKILYSLIINYKPVDFIAAPSHLTKEELSLLISHEENSIRSLEENNYILY